MSQHEAITALPSSGNSDHALIRAMCTRRMAYCFSGSEDVQAFTAADPVDGVVPLYLIIDNTLFSYDSTDSTTSHDGVTCLVSADNKRFKTGSTPFPISVLSVTTTAQPATPSLGDTYLVPNAATGTDWSGKDGRIAIYTARGWMFSPGAAGRLIYNVADDTFYRCNGTAWFAGLGANTFTAGTILPSNLLGGGGKVRWIIENQTTNTPPAVIDGVAYIIGSSPTGTWSGHVSKIAHGENGAWIIYAPSEGWEAYDKSNDGNYQFNGTWLSAFGRLAITPRYYTAGTTWSKPSRLAYIRVTVIGGGGGAGYGSVGAGTNGAAGGSSSFGSHLSASGGNGGNNSGGSSNTLDGAGASGQINSVSVADANATVSSSVSNLRTGYRQHGLRFQRGYGGGFLSDGVNDWSQGGHGGWSEKIIQADALGSTESVTVGSGGAKGASAGQDGIGGAVYIEEYTYS